MSDTQVSTEAAIEQNLMADVAELAVSIDNRFTNSDIREYGELGIDLQTAAEVLVRDYHGDMGFMKSVQRYFKRHNTITSAQARAVLNIWRDDLLKKQSPSEGDLEEPVQTDVASVPEVVSCPICNQTFDTYDMLDEHKTREHGMDQVKQAPVADTGEAADVLEVTTSTKGLDLSGLPDCNLALPNPNPDPSNPYIFLKVKRVRRTRQEDRRYRYGKIVTGNEIVVAGTIEVREFSSDSQEWVGAQKPGDVYRGKYEDQLELALMSPEPFAMLFGKLMKRCGRCGKRLTDEVSQAIGFGLDCEKTMDTYWQGPKYTYIGKDRPDPTKADPKDRAFIPDHVYEQIELRGSS